MLLIPTLLLLLILVAGAEHLYWKLWVEPIDLAIELARKRDLNAQLETLITLKQMTELCEDLFMATSNQGYPYSDSSRRTMARNLLIARQHILSRVGQNPTVRFERSPSKWPFNADGKVML